MHRMPESNSDDKTRTHAPLTGGTMVAHYRIIERIGAGGMGEVYLAEDSRLKRRVALKFLPVHLIANDEIRSRFQREAQAVAKLNHPNIVTIHDVSEFNGRPFFVMEHVEGQSLHHYAHEKPLPLDNVIDYALQICQGIGEAHRAGIVHRDIKPTNIIVDLKGRARLLDFGLAAIAGDDKLTKTGSTLGTVSYMSPEQVSGRDIDNRSDLFSFGLVLYELIAGRTPFRRDSEGATLRAIMQDSPEPLSRYKSDVPPRLQQVIDKLLDKDRELRYQTAEDVIADLKRLIYDSQQTGTRSAPSSTRSLTRLVVGASVIFAAVAGAALLYNHFRPTEIETTGRVPMIAVLPFENLGNPEDEYFADGMTEEITSRLAGIDGLGVISRTSAMQYKHSGKSLSQIGKELGVNYVLEGSVRWAKTGGQSRVRITPQLIRVSDDRHIWANNYEHDLMEVFSVQEEIAAKIVEQLDLKLLESDRKHLATPPTTSQQAYDYYLKGLSAIRRTDWSPPALVAAASNLDSAVMIDPSFALAYAFRSRAYTLLYFLSPTTEYRKLAQESFEKSIKLDPDLPYAHMAAGVFYNFTETDYDLALAELNRAYSELHGDADLVINIALVQFRQGKFDEADENFRKATDLDPLNPSVYMWHCDFYRFMRKYAEARECIDRALALDSSRVEFYGEKLMTTVSQYGDWAKVKEVFGEALRHSDTTKFYSLMVTALGGAAGPALMTPMDSLFADKPEMRGLLTERFRSSQRQTMDLDMFYLGLAQGYGLTGNSKLRAIYLDSTRIAIQRVLKEVPDHPLKTSVLAGVMAYLGKCDEAVQLGARGKELLSIAKCHW
jgi:serine/threonine protein kinase/tetratricopeptide (TPR) repeat protein